MTSHAPELPTEAWTRLEQILERFENAWLGSERPLLDDFLQEASPAERHALLVELVHAELEFRVKAGEPVRVEDYLPRFPELGCDRRVLVDLLAAEYEQRRRREPGLLPEEYEQRFPRLGVLLRSRLRVAPGALAGKGNGLAADRVTPTDGASTDSGGAKAGRTPAVAGYEILGELGRGGMGVVHKARHLPLQRLVALKVMHDDFRRLSWMERRFLAEAQLTGQLQHPGIPPVHEVGVLADGRPFLAMKLIQGRTLANLLQERPTAAADLPRFVAIFEHVCQTLAYAHARGVIHRDLKPSNIMVGAFGEVQVMDWGLAKVLGPGRFTSAENATASDPLVTVRMASQGLSSQTGAVLGTPAFMAPEQARGEVDQLDERCDVFGLGALLCIVLTGQPPYAGAGGADVHLQAARGELDSARARLAASGAEGELVELARRCLAAEKAGRPQNAGEVAQAVARYLAGAQQRLREAEQRQAAAEARAEEAGARARAERRARLLTMGLTASVLLTFLTAGGVAWYFRQHELQGLAEQARQKSERAAFVEEDLGQVAEQKHAGHWDRAWEAVERAEGRLTGSTDEELHERVQQARAELERTRREQVFLANIEEARLQAAGAGQSGFDWAGADRLFQKAFADYGLDVGSMSPEEAAKAVRDSTLAGPLVAALDYWASMLTDPERKRHVREVADLADPDPWRRGLRQAIARKDREAIRKLAREPLPPDMAPPTVVLLVGALLSSGEQNKGLEVLREAQRARPGDFWLCFELAFASASLEPPGLEDAVRYYTAALALKPGSAVVHNNLGIALQDQKKLPEAVAEYEAALRLKADFPAAHFNLGNARRDLGYLPEAAAAFEEALRLKPDYIEARYNLGKVRLTRRELPEAVAAFTEVIRSNPDFLSAHNNLGIALLTQGKLPEAVAAFEEASRRKPNDPYCRHSLGFALLTQGKLPEAVAAFDQAIRLKPDYLDAHVHRGMALRDQGQLPEAAAAFEEVIRLKPDDPQGHHNLGFVLWRQHKLAEAVAAYQQAIRLKPDDPGVYNNLGLALQDHGKLPEAVAAFDEALRLKPNFPEAHHNRGLALVVQNKLPEAESAFREAIRLKPDYARAHFNLGNVLADEGKFSEAADALRKGLEPAARQPGWPADRTAARLREVERLFELDRHLPAFRTGERKPSSAAEQLELAALCRHRAKRLYAASARFAADAFAAQRSLADDLSAGHRDEAACSAALAGCGQGEDEIKPDAKERDRLRQKALDWLRADLAAWAKHAEGGEPADAASANRSLAHWQTDPDLAGVRDKDALDKLPAQERKQWQQLWYDVAALLQRAERK
jgi:serine/threonine protein kinase/Flp pilus assembly protein TadD